MAEARNLTPDLLDAWANDLQGPVALHLKQQLVPIEGEGGVIFPPTYADIGYNINDRSDGTKVAVIDSVGSQANRMEPIFKHAPFASLVPQIEIELYRKEEGGQEWIEKLSLLDLAHRSADAVVHSCPKLAPDIAKAFRALKRRGDAGPLCGLAPTSLLFGVWDSRGGSGEKRPRLVRSFIQAWDVEPLYAAAQFNSVRKRLDADQLNELQKEAKAKKRKLSDVGLDDAPAVFRKVSSGAARQMPEFRDGAVNSERRILGGVVANGKIERNITVNLIALRAIRGAGEEESRAIRQYLMALAIISATADIDLYLREGCHLRYADDDLWQAVPRRGEAIAIDLASQAAKQTLLKYAEDAVAPFRSGWPKELVYKFDLKEAKKLLAKKAEDEEDSE